MISWKPVATLGLVAAGFAAGWFSKPSPPPKIEVKYEDRVEYRDRVVTKEVAGPVKVVVRKISVPGPQGPTVTVEKVVERAGETREVVREVAGEVKTERIEVRTPAPPLPRWLLGGGVVLGRDGLEPALMGGVRLLGPVHAALLVQPVQPTLGLVLHVVF